MASGAMRRAFASGLSLRCGSAVKAIHFASGDQTGVPRTPSTRYASPPMRPTRMNHWSDSSSPLLLPLPPPVLRRELKESTVPSGDHVGLFEVRVGSV